MTDRVIPKVPQPQYLLARARAIVIRKQPLCKQTKQDKNIPKKLSSTRLPAWVKNQVRLWTCALLACIVYLGHSVEWRQLDGISP